MRAKPAVRGCLVDAAAVAALGFALRLGFVLSSRGGLGGVFGYDAGVYFDGAMSLVHGRAPYGDFLLLHPPGALLALAPFAALARLVGDHAAFETANVAFIALGALCAALVVGIARRAGLPRSAGVAGGIFYAVWFGSVYTEISVRLEPLGNFCFLLGVLLLAGAKPTGRAGRLIAAGAALGFAIDVKIWWAAPVALVLAWQGWSLGRRALGWLTAGAAGVLVVVNAPFFALAPTAMWRMVIADQLGRSGSLASRPARVASFSAVHSALRGVPRSAQAVAVAAVALLFLLVVVCAWRGRVYRLGVGIAAAQLMTLALSPSYFPYYADFAAGGLALTVAAAAGGRATSPAAARASRTDRRPRRTGLIAAALTVAVAAATCGSAMVTRRRGLVSLFQPHGVAAQLRHVRCVVSDSPAALIQLGYVTRNLDHGCPDWVDVAGRTYDVDAPPADHFVGRTHNLTWQRDALRYLTSGGALLLIRRATGLSRATRRHIRHTQRLIGAGHGYRAYLIIRRS